MEVNIKTNYVTHSVSRDFNPESHDITYLFYVN